MPVSIGLDYTSGQWKICLLDNGQPTELYTCTTTDEVVVLVRRVCSLYPEPSIVFALPLDLPFNLLSDLTEEQIEHILQPLLPQPAQQEIKIGLPTLSRLTRQSYWA